MAAEGKDVLSRLALLCCLLLIFAGCGSEPSPTEGDTADTARFELVLTRTDKEGRLVMSGRYDYVRKQGSMTAKLLGTEAAETDVPNEIRFFGDRYYSAQEDRGKTYWVEETNESAAFPNEAMVPFPGADLDPKQAVELIRASGDELEELGEAELRGAQTMHYRIKIDPKRLGAQLPAGRRLAHGDPSQERPFTVEFWADDVDRLRRIRIREEMEGRDFGTLTYDFFDFGIPVEVERPPAGQVVTDDEFDRLTEPTDEEMLELCMEELPKDECERMHAEGR